MELAIDTSYDLTNIALSQQGKIISERTWHSGQNHTVDLAPNLIRQLDQAKIKLDSMEAVFVAMGPGSCNGLRVGISFAKGIALLLNIPLLGISTMESDAYPFAYTSLPICPIHQAGQEKIASALYQQRDNSWQRLKVEHLTTIELLCQQTLEETIFCGQMSSETESKLQQHLGTRAIIPPHFMRAHHIDSLVMLGWQKLNMGKHDNLSTLQPIYLRPPHITKPRGAS